MGKAKQTVIGRHIFPRQGDAEAYFKEMLSRYRVGQSVTGEDASDLEALLALHNDVESKTGDGLVGFGVMKGEYGTKCFSVRRADNTEIDFSYLRCIRQSW
jgi:hypothetical protein